MLERKDNNASQEELFHHQSHSPQSEVIQKANMFAAVWINKFAHAQTHREPITESLKNLANDSKGIGSLGTGSKQEPVLDSHPYHYANGGVGEVFESTKHSRSFGG